MRTIAAVVDQSNAPFVVRDVDIDDPGPGEVLVKIAATGFCHTDSGARHGNFPFPLPGVLGHEGAGVVAAVGDGVTTVAEGDNVVIGWPWCGLCRNCLDGEPRYCQRLAELIGGGHRLDGPSAIRTDDGRPLASHFFGQSSFAGYSLTTATALVPVPSTVPIELMGPLACGLSTGSGAVLNTVRPLPGASIVVFGVGSVGLAAVMAAHTTPATVIIAVDRTPSRLTLAAELGATHTIDASKIDPVQAVHDICGGPADASLDCSGVLAVVRQAIDSVGMRGRCVLVGGAPSGAEFTAAHRSTLWGKTVQGTLGGSGRSTRLIGALIDLYAQGRFPFDRLIQTFPLEQIAEAEAASLSGEVVKPVLTLPH